jgi:hypothetical protein
MTLKETVKKMFSQKPCFFEWPEDDTQAVSQGSAVLQCKDDHHATLVVMLYPGMDQIISYNVNLLILLTACAGWKTSEGWLSSCFRKAKRRGGRYQTRNGRVSFDLIVDQANHLTTLHCEER